MELRKKIEDYSQRLFELEMYEEASATEIVRAVDKYFREIEESIYKDTAVASLMGVYNHIKKLENQLKEANEKIEELRKHLKEYQDQFGISAAQEKRKRQMEREDAFMSYRESCELGAFCDDF